VPQLRHILVAEDNEDDVFLLCQALRKVPNPAELHIVNNGAEAVSWLEGCGNYGDRKKFPAPDVLLLDLNMPKLNGFEVLAWIRASPEWGRLTVHVLTASSREKDVRQAYDLHANSYILKPTRLDELVAFMVALHDWHKFACLPFGVRNEAPASAEETARRLVPSGSS
jgi:CheY-like chemotaxis protein